MTAQKTLDSRHIVVTGGAGFIGSHLTERLLAEGAHVTVVDSFDAFYDPAIKRRNLEAALACDRCRLVEADINDLERLETIDWDAVDVVVHLAAKAGVRPSILDPVGYQMTNVVGTQNLLEIARRHEIGQFVFASSSSVYGVNPDVPWRERDAVLLPISPYASTKVSCELLGHVYSRLFGIRFIALRFFTVFGPRQRPDLAIHKFSRMMLAGEPLPVFGDGTTRRDYTYVDDIVDGILAAVGYEATPYEVINLGNSRTVSLAELIAALERVLGVPARIDRRDEQPGDVPVTFADVGKARELLGYAPKVGLDEGLSRFAEWMRD